MSGYTYGTNGDSDEDRLAKYSRVIGSNVQKIKQNVKSLQQLVAQLGTDQDTSQLQGQLHQLQHYTNGLAKDTTSELRAFKALPPPLGEAGRGWRLQRDRLTSQFTEALNDFQAVQRGAALKEKEALSRARSSTDHTLVAIEGPPAHAPQQQLQVSLEQERELEQIREREEQIRQLESDIVDVNQIFKDLATMVHEQGEVIDSIEANVETAQVSVSQGNVQLSAARTYQSRARRKKFIMFIILLVVLAIIIGLIVWSAKN